MTQITPPEPGWQRLDPRMLAITPLRQLLGWSHSSRWYW